MTIPHTCQNCNRESHLFGWFCWWGVWLTLPILVAYLALIVWVVGWVLF